MRTDFVLDALEQPVHIRTGAALDGLVQHSDRGAQQYVSMRFGDRLAGTGIAPPVGS